MLRHHKTAISMLLAVILIGCAGQPTVRYERLTKNSNNTLDDLPRFNLAKSILLFNYEDPKDKSGLTVKSVPAESVSNIFLIRDASGWARKTQIQLTKFDNTNLISSAGIDLEDNRVKVIEQAGGIIVALAPIIAANSSSEQSQPSLPMAIDTEELLVGDSKKYQRKGSVKLQGLTVSGSPEKNRTITYVVEFSAVSDDTVKLSDIVDKLKISDQHALIYSACRQATVRFTSEPLENLQVSATIADPNFVQAIALPRKGVVTMHPSCGANVSSSTATVIGAGEVIGAFIAQAKAIQAAWKTEKND